MSFWPLSYVINVFKTSQKRLLFTAKSKNIRYYLADICVRYECLKGVPCLDVQKHFNNVNVLWVVDIFKYFSGFERMFKLNSFLNFIWIFHEHVCGIKIERERDAWNTNGLFCGFIFNFFHFFYNFSFGKIMKHIFW